MGELVVIVGPIASGKSTVASALGTRLRSAGRNVAVVDLDDVVQMIGGFEGLSTEHFQQSQAVYGGLITEWLDLGFDVIAHGPFFERDEDEALLRAVPEGITPRRVLLLATYEVALARVAADPDTRSVEATRRASVDIQQGRSAAAIYATKQVNLRH